MLGSSSRTATPGVLTLWRHFSSAAPPIGGYTPITTKLWLERLQSKRKGAGTKTGAEGIIAQKTLTYNFSSDEVLKEQYRNPWNRVRIGRIMEDLDSLAGSIAFEHCQVGPNGAAASPLLVTASVDEITVRHPISVDVDLDMQGSVAWTGSSSLDIEMTLTQPHYREPSIVALFSFVHLNASTKKASPVRSIVPSTPQHAQLFAKRQAVAEARKQERLDIKAAGGVLPVPKAAREYIGPLLKEYRRSVELPALIFSETQQPSQHGSQQLEEIPGNAAWSSVPMPATSLANTIICQPQQRNMHGRVFGGFLMRRAFELAFTTAYTFGGARPQFLRCDEITFRRPVDVGDLLRFRSHVIHTDPERGLVCVEVEATLAKVEQGEIHSTNSFSFTFQVNNPTQKLKRVLPTNEEEALRAWHCWMELKEL